MLRPHLDLLRSPSELPRKPLDRFLGPPRTPLQGLYRGFGSQRGPGGRVPQGPEHRRWRRGLSAGWLMAGWLSAGFRLRLNFGLDLAGLIWLSFTRILVGFGWISK